MQLELLLHKKADCTDMDRRALKTEVDASLRTQMSDIFQVRYIHSRSDIYIHTRHRRRENMDTGGG